MAKHLSAEELGKISRRLIKDKELHQELFCQAPIPSIDENKDTILFIGMNPAGGERDAERDNKTGGLFLNYYAELEGLGEDWFPKTDEESSNSDRALVYKKYFDPILTFFGEILEEELIAWEWVNSDPDELMERIKKVRAVGEDDRKRIIDCCNKYKKAKYQLIMRDLVYYHQTSGFKDILKSENNKEVADIVGQMLDAYIEMIPQNKLKLIYVSSSTSCRYVEKALNSKNIKTEDFGGMKYKGIPIIFAGRALNGAGIIDKYSKMRLKNTIRGLLHVF